MYDACMHACFTPHTICVCFSTACCDGRGLRRLRYYPLAAEANRTDRPDSTGSREGVLPASPPRGMRGPIERRRPPGANGSLRQQFAEEAKGPQRAALLIAMSWRAVPTTREQEISPACRKRSLVGNGATQSATSKDPLCTQGGIGIRWTHKKAQSTGHKTEIEHDRAWALLLGRPCASLPPRRPLSAHTALTTDRQSRRHGVERK